MTKANCLPGVLQEIADVTDSHTANMIAQAYGGSRVQIPATAKPKNHWLTDLVGYQKAKEICNYFRVVTSDERVVGLYVELPLGSQSRTEIVRKRIEAGLAKKDSYDQIAREVGVSRMTVIRHKKRLEAKKPPDDRQLNLFSG